MALIVVETTYDPPIDQALWDELLERSAPCMTERNVIWRRTYLSRDRKRSVCQLEAPDADTVRAAYQRGQVPYDYIWSADLIDEMPAHIDT
ncbi:MAG: nickel-binding protein [Cyanobacteria bacterium P01_F01_bin.86]